MLSGGTNLIHDYGLLADANTDLSLPGLRSYGDLVTHPVHGDGVVKNEVVRPVDPSVGIVVYVDNGTTHASGFTYHSTVDVYKNKEVVVLTEDLELFSRKKFLLWRHPTGQWMHGKNPAIGAGIRYAALLFFFFYGMSQLGESAWWAVLMGFSTVVIGLMIRGLLRNWEGKQM